MGLIDIGIQSEILPYVVATVIAGFLISLTGSLITNRFKDKERRDKRSVWIKFLKSDKTIAKCILTFEKITDTGFRHAIISMLIGMFLGFIATFILLSILIYSFGDKPLTIALSSLINIVPYILSIAMAKYFYIIKKEDALLNKSNLFVYYYNIINWFIYTSGSMTLLFINLVYINSNKISPFDLRNILYIFIVSIILIITSFYTLNIIVRRELFDSLKSKLTIEYGKNFPYIHITTKAGEINGNIQDVFNEDIIVLDDNGLKAVVEWNEISTLRLRDKGGTPLDLSYFK